ncbi:MAG: hypothetical protein ACRDCT_19370 [Shewanella sp.]|uniref:Universal stress protein B n=1 Tax=Shewanella cutis TaxID=2766780 RepID=A0ABS9R189_9GAMM|nr:hypothetical protein [Shewanella sp. PS-2]MCG9966358.1 hypothetical protein [Shewanella sp. PS-2]
MHFFWTVCVLSLFPITVWYFISFKRMSSLLESRYPEKWEVLGKVGFINNNSLSNSNKVIMFLLKEEYRELNDGDLNKTASFCRVLLIIGTTLAVLAFIMPILIGKYG